MAVLNLMKIYTLSSTGKQGNYRLFNIELVKTVIDIWSKQFGLTWKVPLIFLSFSKIIRISSDPINILYWVRAISDAKYISWPLLISLLLLGDYILFNFHLPYATVMKSVPLSRTKHYSLKPGPDDGAEMGYETPYPEPHTPNPTRKLPSDLTQQLEL